MKKARVGNLSSPDSGVKYMIKSDVATGLFVGIVVGLLFTVHLAAYTWLFIILALVFGLKMIDIK